MLKNSVYSFVQGAGAARRNIIDNMCLIIKQDYVFLHAFLPDSIMVVRQILDLSVLVRIQVRQQAALSFAEGIFLHGSEASLLAKAEGREKPSGISRMRPLG